MRSFFHKYFHFNHRYPIKVWSAAVIDEIPYSVSFDGSTLRQFNLFTKKIVHSLDYHHLNAFSICTFISTKIYKFENLFLLIKNQRQLEIYDGSLNHIPQFDFDTGAAVIAVHWHKESSRLFVCGTNGWLRCFKVTTEHKVTEFVAEWSLLWEIRSTSDWIKSLAHDDFMQIIYGAVEDSIFAWDLNTGDFKYRLPQMHNNFKICQVDVDPESSVVITSGLDGYIRTWDIKELECKNLTSFEVAPKGHLSFVRCGRQIVTIGCDRVIKFYGISESALRCSIPLAEPAQHVNPEEVIRPQLVVLETSKGSICLTSYKEQIQSALLGFAPEEFLSADTTITSMDFDDREKRLLCLCVNNFVIASTSAPNGEKGQTTTIDLDIPNSNKCKRCCVSEVASFCMDDDILYVGFKNGSLKCINLRKMECIMLEEVPLEETIVYITTVKGLFVFNHPMCGGMNPIKTGKDTKFIVCYTDKGIINVWCEKCHNHLLFTNIGMKPLTCFKLIPEKSLLIVSAGKNLSFFRIDAYDFNILGEISTSGNQTITSFQITEAMGLIAGTSSGEIMILQIEEGEKEFHFTLKHHIGFDAPVFKIYYTPQIFSSSLTGVRSDVVVISLKNGSVVTLNTNSAKIISRGNHVDAEPLTAVLFKIGNEGRLGAYLAFGSQIHYVSVDTYEEPEPLKEEEEEEEEEKKEAPKEENEDQEEKIIKYFDDAQSNISRLMYLCQKEELKKRRAQYIPEMGTTAPPLTPTLPEKQRKPDNSEIMERNHRNALKAINEHFEDIYYYGKSYGTSLNYRKRSYSSARRTNRTRSNSGASSRSTAESAIEEIENEGQLNLMVTPFFYTDLPQNSKYMVPSKAKTTGRNKKTDSQSASCDKKETYVQLPEKYVIYNNGNKFDAIIDENDDAVERTTSSYIPPGGRFVLSKLKTEQIKAPTIIHKVFVGPPSAPRVLFDDPTTLNGLNFFDPRGFRSKFGEEEEDQGENGSLRPTNENSYLEEEEEEEGKTGEEEMNEIAPIEQEKIVPRQRTDLERRRHMRRNRVPIHQQMKVNTKPKASSQLQIKNANDKPRQPLAPNLASTQKNSANNKPGTPKLAETQRIRPQREAVSSHNIADKNKINKPPIIITHAKTPALSKTTEPNNNVFKPSLPLVSFLEQPHSTTSDKTDESLAQTLSPKHVQFAPSPDDSGLNSSARTPRSGPNSGRLEDGTEEQDKSLEAEPAIKIIDISLKRGMAQQRKRKALNQPINLKEKASSLAQYTKNKLPEPEKYVKPKPISPPLRHPAIEDENEMVKAAMSSPHLAAKIDKKISGSKSGSTGKKRRRSRLSSSSARSETSSNGDSSNQQDDTINLPVTQSPELAKNSRDEEQARINQLRRKRINDEMYNLFNNNSFGRISTDGTGDMDDMKNIQPMAMHFPQLKNLARFWEQKMLFPVLPFEFGNPNTAKIKGEPCFDMAMRDTNPIDPPHLFSGSENHGVEDLVKRFNKFMAFNLGEVDEIDDVFEVSQEDDILSNLPPLTRRLSF